MLTHDFFRFEYWLCKAKILESLKRTEEAILNYEIVLKIHPTQPYSLLHLAVLYLEKGEIDKTIELVNQLQKLKIEDDKFNCIVDNFVNHHLNLK